MGVHLAELHEYVDVSSGFGKVDEADDIGMVDLVADLHFGFNALDDILLQLHFGVVVSFLFGDLHRGGGTCLSSYILEITLQAYLSAGLFLSQEM